MTNRRKDLYNLLLACKRMDSEEIAKYHALHSYALEEGLISDMTMGFGVYELTHKGKLMLIEFEEKSRNNNVDAELNKAEENIIQKPQNGRKHLNYVENLLNKLEYLLAKYPHTISIIKDPISSAIKWIGAAIIITFLGWVAQKWGIHLLK